MSDAHKLGACSNEQGNKEIEKMTGEELLPWAKDDEPDLHASWEMLFDAIQRRDDLTVSRQMFQEELGRYLSQSSTSSPRVENQPTFKPESVQPASCPGHRFITATSCAAALAPFSHYTQGTLQTYISIHTRQCQTFETDGFSIVRLSFYEYLVTREDNSLSCPLCDSEPSS